jgi:hypothetical protein
MTQINTNAVTKGGIHIPAKSPVSQSAAITERHEAPVGFIQIVDRYDAKSGGTVINSTTAI